MTDLIHISGAKEMEQVLKRLPEEVAKRVVMGALRKGAQVVLDEARDRAPVGTEAKGRARVRRTKRGKVSISNYGKLKPSLRIVNVPATRSAHSAEVAVSVGKAFWGMFVEFGTRFMPKRPFFRPAFESKKFEALDKIGQALGDGIEKAAAKLAGPYAKSGLRRK